MSKTTQILSIEIETATKLIVAAARRAAMAAVEEAFANMGLPTARTSASAGNAAAATESKHRPRPRPRPRPRTTTASPRRSAEEISQLAERCCAATSEDPGQTMAVLAQQMNLTSAALQAPMARLRAAERIRVIGQRQFTQYYPRTNQQSGADDIQTAA